MEIRCLIENTSNSEAYASEHGLSLYIKTKKHQLLFDFGASAQFIINANLMGVDLTQIDLGVLSHGHYDHGGGLDTFLKLNEKAKICVHQKAFEKHFSKRRDEGIVNIGIDPQLSEHPQIFYLGKHLKLDEELMIFSDIKERTLVPKGNQAMMIASKEGTYGPDGFLHEQNLLVSEGNQSVLIAGCAHRGILNIVNRGAEHLGKFPEVVVGGFHLHSRDESQCESEERIRELGKLLLQTGSRFYTGHCTGIKAFQLLKEVMGERIHYLSAGQIINL